MGIVGIGRGGVGASESSNYNTNHLCLKSVTSCS